MFREEAIMTLGVGAVLQKQKEALQRDFVDAGLRYFIVMESFHSGISRLLSSAIANLISNEETEISADVFESSTVLYEDYITSRRLLLCAQRDGAIGAAAEPRVIRSAATAFHECLDAWKAIKEAEQSMSPPPDSWALIYWKLTKIDPESKKLLECDTAAARLSSMKTVIEAIVPYLMLNGRFASVLQDLSHEVSLIADPTAPVRVVAQEHFLATFMIRTSTYDSQRSKFSTDAAACSVSHSTIARERAFAQTPLLGCCSPNSGICDSKLREGRDSRRRRMEKDRKILERWTIDEKSVIISYKLYAWGWLTACGCLVLGGLAVGLSVQDRIPGVDPFEITTFCWVLAGFIIVVVKSIRVENWPWSRFFRGEVLCRSVSEVTAVTGMDPQTILAILLRQEQRVGLQMRGPFGAVFEKRAADGFSIDVPMRTSTLVDGGLILVKVESVLGPALVTIRSQLWTAYNSVSAKDDNTSQKALICRDYGEPTSWGTGDNKLDLYTLCCEDLQWLRVEGIFDKEVYFT